MPNCSVFNCKKTTNSTNAQNTNVSFHLFPKDEFTRSKWTLACAHPFKWTPTHNSRICSEHFDKSCFVTLSNNKRKVKEGAVPTLKLPKGQPYIVSRSSYYKIVYSEKSQLTKSENQRISSTTAHSLDACENHKRQMSVSTSTHNAPFLDLAKITKVENQNFIKPDVIDLCEVSEPGTSISNSTYNTPSLDIASLTKLDNQRLTMPPTAQLVDSSESLSTYNIQLQEQRYTILQTHLKMKNTRIKNLETQNRHFRRKLAELRELIKDMKENFLNNKEDRLIMLRADVEIENLCRNKNRKKTATVQPN